MNNVFIPWVEKYRPITFDNIVLDPLSKLVFKNIVSTNNFPNLLLYGPPGTGKTTTIINIINMYQKKNNEVHKGLVIHLNASDERGIDIIRNQIKQFVDSDTLFVTGTKFVILDEVDYMTKHAQQSLKQLLQYSSNKVRFCLMCNYISKLDDSLQNMFMRIRFNQLPEKDIHDFLRKICINESLNIDDEKLSHIQKLYNSDIRSMINYIQSNRNIIIQQHVLNKSNWIHVTHLLKQKNNYNMLVIYFDELVKTYNTDIKDLIKYYLNYIIIYEPDYINIKLINFIKLIMHVNNVNIRYYRNYSLLTLNDIISNI
jgi:DNA polymerase III delta prime subunit